MKKKGPHDAPADFGLGEVFRGIGGFLDLVARLAEEGKSEARYSGELQNIKGIKGLKGVYGFTVKLGPGGGSRVEPFGNLRREEEGQALADVREPIIDVFDEDDTVVVVAELPGVEENDIDISVSGDTLFLRALGKDRKYSKKTPLPASTIGSTMKSSFKNGILEVVLKKARE